MNDTLVRFFNKINYKYSENFIGTIVEKVAVNKQKETWTVYLKSPKVIPVNEMIDLINLTAKGLPDVITINIVMNYENITDEDVISYIKYFLYKKIEDNPSLSTIKDIPLTLKEKIDIEVRGEIYMSKKTLENINKKREQENQPKLQNCRKCHGNTRKKIRQSKEKFESR